MRILTKFKNFRKFADFHDYQNLERIKKFYSSIFTFAFCKLSQTSATGLNVMSTQSHGLFTFRDVNRATELYYHLYVLKYYTSTTVQSCVVTVLMHYSVKEREPVLQQIFTNVEKSQKLTNF